MDNSESGLVPSEGGKLSKSDLNVDVLMVAGHPFVKFTGMEAYIKHDYYTAYHREASSEFVKAELENIQERLKNSTKKYTQNNGVFALVNENSELYLTTYPSNFSETQRSELFSSIFKEIRPKGELSGYTEGSFFIPMSQNLISDSVLTPNSLRSMIDLLRE